MITVHHYLILSGLMFTMGVMGVLLRRNALILLMSVELMLNSANIAMIAFARAQGDHTGHIIALFVIAVAAAEAAVGLALVIGMFRHRGTLNVDEFRTLMG